MDLAFGYASALLRAQTGPVERFARMIREGGFAAMLTSKTAYVREVTERCTEKAVEFYLLFEGADNLGTVPGGDCHVLERFHWVLEREPETVVQYADCWMTAAVMPIGRLELPRSRDEAGEAKGTLPELLEEGYLRV